MNERTCPVRDLPQADRERWDFPTLCEHFDCEVCVATPEDLGWSGDPLEECGATAAGEELPF